MLEAKPITADELAGDVAPPVAPTDLPPPAAAPSPSPAAEPPPVAGALELDAKGTPFDPARHVHTKHPRTGCWKPRRKSAAAQPPPSGGDSASYIPPDPPPAPPPPVADRFDLLADVYARAGIAGAMAAFGDEWAPDDKPEFEALRGSVAAYLRATQQEELSPGWALSFALVTYAGKRLPRPKTQSRIAYFRDKVAAWWRGRSIARTVAAMPPPNA